MLDARAQGTIAGQALRQLVPADPETTRGLANATAESFDAALEDALRRFQRRTLGRRRGARPLRDD